MSPKVPPTYEIVATGIGENAGKIVRASIETEPLLIGSGDAVDLKLDGKEIQTVHARVLVTNAGRVLLINLVDSTTIRRNAEVTPAFKPIEWEPGTPIQIGDYELQLDTITEKKETPAPGKKAETIVFPQEEILENQPAENPPLLTGSEQGEIPPSDTNVEDTQAIVDSEPPIQQEEAEVFQHTPRMPEPAFNPPMPSAAPVIPSPPKSPPTSSKQVNVTGTLPKDWQQAGSLSAQAIIDPVKLVAGERVRIPISVRNHYDHPLQLRIHLAGLSQDEVELSTNTLELAAGAIRAFDIILEPNTPPLKPTFNLQIRLHDKNYPDAALTLPIQLVFKDAPNITCWFEPKTVNDQEQTYLHIQNHTQAAATVLIAGHSATKDLRIIIPDQTQIEIAPGQVREIPIRFDATHRGRWLNTKQPFSITVQQGNRAPLDIPGIVRVRSRVSPLVLSLVGIFTIIVIAAIVMMSQSGNDVSPTPTSVSTEAVPATETEEEAPLVVPTVVTTAPATITATTSPTIEKTDTPVPTSASPTPSLTSLDDPRPEDCTVAIPSGWIPYTVVRDDRVYQLALKHGTTVEEITEVNCLTNPRLLQIGQVLLLPAQEE